MKSQREQAAEAFDQLFAKGNDEKPKTTTKEEQEENKRFREAMWKHAGSDGDAVTNFDKFYDEHRDKIPKMHQNLGRDGLRTRYHEAYSKQRDFKGEELEKAKDGFLNHSF